MNLDQVHSVYFVGIGGIGMSALARWFNHAGKHVGGYDRAQSALTLQLEKEGMDVIYDDDPSLIADTFLTSDILLVYTPAVPEGNKILATMRGYNQAYKRSEVLGIISANYYTIAVAGTHGKTTTSTMIAHLLHQSGRNITAFVGGISTNYESNVLFGDANDTLRIVVEADEFDRSFLRLSPDYAVITSMDADHLDIYDDASKLEASFKEFSDKVSTNGKLIMSTNVTSTAINCTSTYGSTGDSRAENIRIQDGYFTFDYSDPDYQIKDIRLLQPGYHNVDNAIAAIKTCLDHGLSVDEVKAGLSSYRGVKRRFEYIIKSEELVFVDDYAHHPVEIDAFLRSLKALYPDKKVTAVFQPHLYSRTSDFATEFGASLSLADEVILLEIYPAREQPLPGVSSKIILDQISHARKEIITKNDIVKRLKPSELEVIATIGAGDIDQLVQPIKQKLTA